jgi:BNR repeat protein
MSARAAPRPATLAAARSTALGAALAVLSGCGGPSSPPHPPQLAEPVQVTGASPYPAGCNPPVPGVRLHLGAEVEPHLAIDPADPRHLVAAWQQDRWDGGGANGTGSAASFDGGRSWSRRDPAFTACAGGGPEAWDRTSDPWVAVAADGTVHLMALAFDDPWNGTRSAMLASRSTDGGRSWSAPATLALEASRDLTLDKNALTADPGRPGFAYAVWDRLEGLTGPAEAVRGPAWLARSRDAGVGWEGPWLLHDPGPDAQTIASQIVVLPDGALVNLLVLIRQSSTASPVVEVAVLRSVDADADPLAGPSWTGPFTVAAWVGAEVRDPLDDHAVRAGDLVPALAVDRSSGPRRGTLYAAWQQGFGGVAGIAFSRSSNGGVDWTAPARANAAGDVPAFTPALAVAASGRVGLGYYDWRDPPAGAGAGLWTTRWLATSDDGGDSWTEAAAGGPFDLRRSPTVPDYFLGDYAGLVGGDDAFTSLFAMTPFQGEDRADLFAGPPQP